MKKNYFILSLLALAATSALAQVEVDGVGKGNALTNLAQLTNPKEAFTLNSSERGALNVVEDEANGYKMHSIKPSNAEDPFQQFFIEKIGENYYLKAFVNGKYAKATGERNVFFTEETTDGATPITLEYNNADGFWRLYFPGAYAAPDRLNMQDNSGGFVINDWNQDDGGNEMTITSVGEPKAVKQVTFDIYVDEEQKNSVKKIVFIDEAPVLDTEDFATYTFDKATIDKETETVKATFAGYKFPFELSTDFANAKWYFVSVRDKQSVWFAEDGANQNVNKNGGNIGDNKTDAAQYAFVGDATDYNTVITVFNKEVGDGKTLQIANENNDTWAQFLDAATENTSKVWHILDRKDGKFMLQTENGTNYINDHGGYWRLWNNPNDDGSFFKVQAVPEAALVDVTYKIQYNGEVVASAKVQQYEGAAYELPTNINLGNLLEYTFPTGTVEADAEVVVEAAINANSSIKFSDAIDEDTEWLYLITNNKYSIAQEDGLTIVNKQDKEVSEYAMWALVGNPYSFKIYNLAFGEEYSLHFAEQKNEANGQLLEDNNDATWTIKGNDGIYRIYNDNGFYLNDHGGKSILIAWTDGSEIKIEDVPAEDIAAIESTPTPVSSIEAAEAEVEGIFTIDGRKVEKLQRGVNIIRQRNAEGGIDVKKVIVK